MRRMIEVTGIEQKRLWASGTLPPVEVVRPGLWSIPVPIPDNPLRYTLVYALELARDRGVALVDAGWDTDETWLALCDGLTQAGFSIADVRAVLVTHMHADHYGLAGRIRENSGAWVGLHPADAALAAADADDSRQDDFFARVRSIFVRSGIPVELAPDAEAVAAFRSMTRPTTTPDVLIEDGERPDLPGWDLTAIWTPGHTPGHLCFASESRRVLMSGDHVLPRITPSIGIRAGQLDNPLRDFLDSLDKVADVEEEIGVHEVLPAHEYRFRGAAARAAEIRAHHDERLNEIRALLSDQPGATCWELTEALRWSRPWAEIPADMRPAANGETLAHLALLESVDEARRVSGQSDRWFACSTAAGTTVA